MTTYVAVVHGCRTISFVAAAESCEALLQRVAEYCRSRKEIQLLPTDAEVLSALLAEGETESAIRFYFERTGRWEDEWLDLRAVSDGAADTPFEVPRATRGSSTCTLLTAGTSTRGRAAAPVATG